MFLIINKIFDGLFVILEIFLIDLLMASTSAFSSIKIADEATIKQQQLKLKKEIMENAFRRSRTEERHIFAGTIEFMAVQDHILESLCRHSDSSESPENCQLCRYEKQLGLPLLPEMIFPQNQLTISCRGKTLINFNAFDALQMVDKTHLPNVQVGPSAVWQSARQQEMSPARQFKQPFDWTYTSNYQGTLGEGVQVEPTDVAIDYERLKRRDPIQFHSQIILYEDELADNGCAQMMIRVRVMPETFLLLCRFYLRVDHVMVRILDTRLYGTAENREFAVREWTKREAAYSELSKEALDCIIDPNALFAHVPLIETRTEKIFYPK